MNPFAILLVALLAEVAVGLGMFAYLLRILTLIRNNLMALDFSKLQAAATEVGASATALQTQAAASDDVSNQAAIDAVTQTLTTANVTLAALIVPVTPPAS